MGEKMAQKKGKLLASHRYNLIPLLRSRPGGVLRELVVQDLPRAKVQMFSICQRNRSFLIHTFFRALQSIRVKKNSIKNIKSLFRFYQFLCFDYFIVYIFYDDSIYA